MKKRIAIIGAGPAGLTAAYQLTKSDNLEVIVYESSNSVGGMAKTIKVWDQYVDIGPHRFFSSDPRVNKIWLEAVNGEYAMVSRLTRIFYKNKFFDYPLKAANALKNLGIIQAGACIVSYLAAKCNPRKKDITFEDWVTNRFGKKLYKIFFKSYSEKLWGIPCTDLDSDFATQRIKKLSLFEAIKSAFLGNKKNKHKTLVDEFAYPIYGAGLVYEKMAEAIIKKGGKIFFETKIDRVEIDPEGVEKALIHLANGIKEEFDHVVSTMPINYLVSGLGAPQGVIEACNNLKFRNTIIVYLKIEGKDLFPDQWIYVHSPDLETGRITNFNNWVPEITNNQPNSILCLEYWCFDDPTWKSDNSLLVEQAVKDITKSGLIKNRKILDSMVYRVPKCYPIYSVGYKKNLKIVEDYLDTLSNISVIGRYGAFKYNNQDHSILMGILAAENILEGKNHNLWEINTDYEYQESSKITSTGLVNQ